MGTSLTGKQIKNTYKSLIKVSDNTEASASAKQLSDGNGNDFGVYIDTDGVFGIGSAPSYSLDVSSRTDGVALPVGTTANRPTGFNGLIRYNSTIGKVEFYDTGWKTIFTTSGGTISGSVTITGDLTVQGDNTIIEAQTVEVEDNILNLNRTQGTPDTATATTSGISIYRGDGVTEASFIFDDTDDTWDLTNNLVIAGTLQSSSYTDGTATLTGGTLSNAVLADGVTATTQANSDNSTKIATTAYVKSVVTLEDLDFAGGTGTGSVDLDSQTFTIAGTANEIETSASGQTLTIGLPDDVVITGDLTVDTNTLYVDSTNNRVGIGTASPNYGFSLSNSNTLTAVYQQFTNGTTGTTATDGTVMGIDSDGDFLINNQEAKEIKLYTSDTLRTVIDSSGNVGVNNDNPNISGFSRAITLGGADSGFEIANSGVITAILSGNAQGASLSGVGSSGIRFRTSASGGTTERMKIHSTGDISFRDGSANEAFYWDASTARLGIGTGSAPSYPLDIVGSRIRLKSTSGNAPVIDVESYDTGSFYFGVDNPSGTGFGNGANVRNIYSAGAYDLAISTNATEKMRIASSGSVGIGTTSPSNDVSGLHIAVASSTDQLYLERTGGGTGKWWLGTAANSLYFHDDIAASTRMIIDSSGNVGIGTTSPANGKLQINSATNQISIETGTAGDGRLHIGHFSNGTFIGTYGDDGGVADVIRFGTHSGDERMRITSAGGIEIPNQNAINEILFTGSEYTNLYSQTTSGFDIGTYSTSGTSYLRLLTEGTERMRITSAGYLKASNTASYYNATGNYHEFQTNSGNNAVGYFTHSDSSSPYGAIILFTGAAPDNNTNYFLACSDTAATRLLIYSDGDVWTSDAGTLTSDETLKNTITDATPKLDDVMQLKVRNFYWNEDFHPNKTDKKNIGFIAQEFEQVFPALVSEHKIKEEQTDEDGNVLEEAVYKKGIKEGKLIPILVKAMQEQQEIINDLKARIETLENQ